MARIVIEQTIRTIIEDANGALDGYSELEIKNWFGMSGAMTTKTALSGTELGVGTELGQPYSPITVTAYDKSAVAFRP